MRLCKFEVTTPNGLGEYAFITLGVKVAQNFTKYPRYHVTYVPEKFEAATFNGLGDAFTRKYII